MKKRNYRRGIAIEMAIGLMLLVIALSIILLTVSALQIKNQRYDFEAYEKKVLEYTIEDMIAVAKKEHEVSINGKKFTVEKTDESEYTIKKGDEAIYTVTVVDKAIASWKTN